jgi:hypothetical protein
MSHPCFTYYLAIQYAQPSDTKHRKKDRQQGHSSVVYWTGTPLLKNIATHQQETIRI